MFSKSNYIHFILIYLKREHIYMSKRQHVDRLGFEESFTVLAQAQNK